jgi:ABC-type Na+ efflux pump permease subunit
MNYFLVACVFLIFKVEGLNSASIGITLIAGAVSFVEVYFFILSVYFYRAAEAMSKKAIEDYEDFQRLNEVLSSAHDGN